MTVGGTEFGHTSSYAQVSYVKTLLAETKDAKGTQLSIEGWLPSEMDPAINFTDVSEAAIAARKQTIAAGKEVVLAFRPETMFKDSSRHLPPGTSFKLVPHKADPKTYTLSSEAACDVDFKITTFEYFVCHVELNPAVVSVWNSQLLSGASHVLPVQRHWIRSHTVPIGLTEHRISLQEQGTLPLVVCVGFVDQKAIVGDFKLSQFRYSHNSIASIELTVNGMTV